MNQDTCPLCHQPLPFSRFMLPSLAGQLTAIRVFVEVDGMVHDSTPVNVLRHATLGVTPGTAVALRVYPELAP